MPLFSTQGFHMYPALKLGDTIGLITPSSPLFPGRLEAGIAYFEQKGYKPELWIRRQRT